MSGTKLGPARKKAKGAALKVDEAPQPPLGLNGPAGAESVIGLEEVRYGRAIYPVRHGPLKGRFEVGPSGTTFRPLEGDRIVGVGADREGALRGFQREVHVRVQRLLDKFEGAWSERERQDWAALNDLFDLETYRRGRRVTIALHGRVLTAEGDLWRVRWDDGREQELALAEMPDVFAALGPGDWFEMRANVVLESIGASEYRIDHVCDARWIAPPEPMGEEKERELWLRDLDNAPREPLPESDFDWTSQGPPE